MIKKFIKNTENFVCEYCGEKVTGNGYTNHCPKCLYSKHVDINPGDRASSCCGLMMTVDFELTKGEYVIIQECKKCGIKKKNRLAENDNMEVLINLSKTIAKKLYF
ncbi:MAG: hypothetical protein COT92_02390 [Candidatus Doudnabacteria bacterium CG10_big_fil_rev_8_21_14_0_10_42_18]|uniref:RNHCP domain-containing protein n=1 Tax=Candidatus Doudnabacteria bacterium CG10_big_fil_rev_8_21_14_0_10_42_18 TaxID=1974552 RepID=A0A2H0VAV3_9BACT|nr:MAG: hypothetical protein COT92_02390 [Candidatus Doudnabacteria bacterium CG10_big_fil_rev_8_21_14_0_10_42_18]